jgi:hypothetical protein
MQGACFAVFFAFFSPGCGGDGKGSSVDGGTGDSAVAGDGPRIVMSRPPVLSAVRFRQVGRFGDDARIELMGSDPEGDITSAYVTFNDAVGKPVMVFDLDGNGKAESASNVLPLDTVIEGMSASTTTVTVKELLRTHAQIAQVRVAFIDATTARSSERDAMLEKQVAGKIGEACDPKFIDNRCDTGLGCKGAAPTTCKMGEAPTITRVMYLRQPDSATIQVEGNDADDDVAIIRLEFMDSKDQPVSIDLDGDGSRESTTFDADAHSASSGGKYFYRFESSLNFSELVGKIAMTVIDRGGLMSPRTAAALIDPPQRNIGQACDPRGFDACRSSACLPGIVGAANNRCVAISPARTSACSQAKALEPAKGITTIRGEISFPSLYDAPAGCASNDPRLQAERMIKLVLPTAAARVVLSTNNNYTNFDTVLYVVSTCDSMPALAWCSDDRRGMERPSLAQLELVNLAAGTYFIVVDSFNAETGRFQLDLTLQ